MFAPLRILIPVLSLAVGLTLVAFQAFQVDHQLVDREMTNAHDRLRSEMTSLQGVVNSHFKAGDKNAIRRVLSGLGFKTRTRETALIDDAGIIIAAGRLELIGKNMSALGGAIDLDAVGRVKRRMAGEVSEHTSGNHLTAYYPVVIGHRGEEVRASRIGIIFVQYSLVEDRAEIRTLITQSTQQGVAFVFVVIGLVWLVLHFGLNRRVARLVEVTQRFAGGDFSATAALKGRDELAELGRAYDDMGVRIAEAQAVALASKSLLAEAQSIAHIGSWRRDIVNDTLTWSDEIYRIFGLQVQKSGADYEAFLEAVHPADRDALQATVSASIETHAPYNVEHRVVWPDGTVRCVEERGEAEYFADGSPAYMTGTVQDITLRKQAEIEVLRLNESLEIRVEERTADLAASNDELRTAMDQLRETQGQLVESEKMASLGGLVAGVAHEINTPIGISVTAATHLSEVTNNFKTTFTEGLMKRRDLESYLATAEQSAGIIFANLHRASELIKSFKQVAVDQSSDDRRTFNARDYIDEIVLSLGPRLKKTAHRLTVTCDPELVLDSYPGAYSQILTNLIMNSLIHAYDEDSAGLISIDLQADKDGVMLRYADDGKGMDAEQAAKVFEPFFTTKRGAGGSGLGMHILYNLVTRKLNGAVFCKSAPGQGTTFTIAAPLPRGEQDDRTAA